MKVEIVATARARFAKPGTKRVVSPSEARALVALGQAEYVNRSSPRTYERRDMVAEPITGVVTHPVERHDLNDPRVSPRPRSRAATAVPAATTKTRDGQAE